MNIWSKAFRQIVSNSVRKGTISEEEGKELIRQFENDELKEKNMSTAKNKASQNNSNGAIWEQLRKPFPANLVRWRVSKTAKNKTRGLALAYVTARAVQNRLDAVVGPENWERKHKYGPGSEVICQLSICVNGHWITKSDGAGPTNYEEIKGGLSDAFKRAAVNFGIARYLYTLPTKWVNLTDNGNINSKAKRDLDVMYKKEIGQDKREGDGSSEAPEGLDEKEVKKQQLREAIKAKWQNQAGAKELILDYLEDQHGVRRGSKIKQLDAKELKKILEITR